MEQLVPRRSHEDFELKRSCAPRYSSNGTAVALLQTGDWVPSERSRLQERNRHVVLLLRVKFDDPGKTWLYIDPARGAVISRFDRWLRFDRWVYHGLHSLDFPFLWRYRPWWDVVVIVLLAGGLALSVTGVMMGFHRIRGSVLIPRMA